MLLSARSKALSCCLSRTLATSAMAAARGVAVVWYRNDLRVHDHDALAEAAKVRRKTTDGGTERQMKGLQRKTDKETRTCIQMEGVIAV